MNNSISQKSVVREMRNRKSFSLVSPIRYTKLNAVTNKLWIGILMYKFLSFPYTNMVKSEN